MKIFLHCGWHAMTHWDRGWCVTMTMETLHYHGLPLMTMETLHDLGWPLTTVEILYGHGWLVMMMTTMMMMIKAKTHQDIYIMDIPQ